MKALLSSGIEVFEDEVRAQTFSLVPLFAYPISFRDSRQFSNLCPLREVSHADP